MIKITNDMDMTKIFLPLLTCLPLLISGCSGSSNSTKSNLPAGSFCPQQSVDVVDGVLVTLLSFDDNSDNCLSPAEQRNMEEFVADKKRYIITRDAEQRNDAPSILQRLYVQGNAEVSADKVQIHPQGSDNNAFGIVFELNVAAEQSAQLHLMFSDQPASAKTGTAPESMTFSDFPAGNNVVAISCKLQDNLSFECWPTYYLTNGELRSIDLIAKHSNDGENFTNTNPQPGYISVTLCQSGSCFDNYADVPASFN